MRISRGFLPFVALTLAAAMQPGWPASARSQTTAPAPKPAASTPSAPAGNAQRGQQLFTSYGCYECHGREAQGSTATGPRLAPRPIPFAAFTKYVRGSSGQMPPYTSKVVSDADLADVYAFLQSRPQPPAADSIPLLK